MRKNRYKNLMATVDFLYNGSQFSIQCKEDDKIEEIIDKFLVKCEKKKNSIYFLYNGKILDQDLIFIEAANNLDKINKVMKVQAIDTLIEEESSSLKKSKNIICPECYENAHISIDDSFKITIYDCKNKHKSKNIQLKQFDKTQYINQSKIICDICKKEDKSKTYKNTFFLCCTCKVNLCPMCKSSHNNSHYIIDYEDKDYFCFEHCENYIFYCTVCKKDICTLCEKKHYGHKTITYGSIMPKIDEYKINLLNLNDKISILRKDIKNILTKLDNLSEDLESYYQIYNNLVNNFDIKKRNYSVIQNVNDFKKYNDNFIRNINEIINDNNIKNKFNNLMDMYRKISSKDMNSIEEKEEGKETKENEINSGEKNEINIEEKNEINIPKYNPSDDKYENFNITKMKELELYELKMNYKIVKFMLILHDRRVLFANEIEDNKILIYIFDLNQKNKCDIIYKIDNARSVDSIYQLNDDNLIILFSKQNSDCVKVYQIKKNYLEEISCLDESLTNKMYQLSNSYFILSCNDIGKLKFVIYKYEKNKLLRPGFFELDEDVRKFKDLCEIKKNEVAILYSKEGKLFGKNGFLCFYDIWHSKIKILKLGDDYGRNYLDGALFLLDEDNLLAEHNKNFFLIDVKNRVIKKSFQSDNYLKILDIFLLNNNLLLISLIYGKLIQYEYKNCNLKCTGIKDENDEIMESGTNSIVKKYPGNKLIIYANNIVHIYG